MTFLVLCFPISMKSQLCADGVLEGCIFYGDFGSTVCDQQSFEGSNEPGDVCPFSGFFFFQSALVGSLGEKHDGRAPSFKVSKGSGQTARNSTFKMANGDVVSCYWTNSANGIPLLQGFKDKSVAAEREDFCEGSPVPDTCIKDSTAHRGDLDEHSEEEEAGVLMSSSSSPEIEVRPPLLDWGTKNLYSPSLAILKVSNKHNESDLNVYDLFSTNTQFNAFGFKKFSLAPGESASISFVFLPRWLGTSSAQLVLQTSFGGFIIRAIGVATISPYQLQPFMGFNISTGKRLSGNLSLYNPSIDVLYVKEVEAWISISGSKKDHRSALVSCSTDRFQKYYVQSDSPIDSEWLSLRRGELGSSRVDFRPHQHWEVPPYSFKTIVELNLWPHLAGKVSGAICMKLGNSSQVTETVVLPIDIEVHEREGYTDSSSSFSLHFDTLSPCKGKKSVFSVSLRNDASYLLNIVKISEETSAREIFEIRYREGLLLFPGTVTQIASISYNHPFASKDKATENHNATVNCFLTIKTNDSVNPDMSIPCHDLVLSSCLYHSGSHNIESESSYTKLFPKNEDVKCASAFTPKSFEATESDDLGLDNWRSQATLNTMSVLEDQELLFPVVQVGSHYSKWISVHNPSQKPVVMQLVLNSGLMVDHCKSNDELSELAFMARSSHIDSEELRVGFSVAEHAVTEAFVHPQENAVFGPVIFRPLESMHVEKFCFDKE
ncbi:hypothetical protein KSP40_PGU011855 [Platanthera guangdongensis]|uniref:Transmembrane protein 131-like N-terminal domain-containing protein n=1 Tax=Platanthera guangdongensis TaxID=2320717 RepID=A0ABR2LK53_9ASPA